MPDDYFTYYVYILASQPKENLYVGITNDIVRRVWEHQNKTEPTSFTAKYNVDKLIYIEKFDNVIAAILYEKRLKKWQRSWKFALITKTNPHWHDLSTNRQHVA